MHKNEIKIFNGQWKVCFIGFGWETQGKLKQFLARPFHTSGAEKKYIEVSFSRLYRVKI